MRTHAPPLVDQPVPLSDVLSATTLPDYLSAIGK